MREKGEEEAVSIVKESVPVHFENMKPSWISTFEHFHL